MNVRFLSILLGLAALQWVGAVQAQNVPPKDLKSDEIRRNAVEAHQKLAREFADFQKQIQLLKNRLERSPNVEDKDRAAQLQKVLDRADSTGIRIKFARLEEHLRKPVFTLDDYKEAFLQNEVLAKHLGELLELFDGQNNRLSDEIRALENALKMINAIIANQKLVRTLTEGNKTDPKDLKDQQQNVTKETAKLNNALNSIGKDNNAKPGQAGGEAKPSASTPKDGKGGSKSEAKDGGKSKPGEGKDHADPKGSDKDKPGEAKKDDGKSNDGKPGDSKAKDGDKDSPSTSGKSGDSKPGDSSSKDSGMPGEAKDSSSGQPSDSDGSKSPPSPPGPPMDTNPGESSGGKAPPSPPTPPGPQGEPMPAGRPADGDLPRAKGGGDPPDAGPMDAAPDGDVFEQPIGKKQAIEAYNRMRKAEDELPDPSAAVPQTDAINNLDIARQEIEKRLKVLRQEELEKILATLMARCERMRAMQKDVLENAVDGTIATWNAIQNNSDKKPNDANLQASLRLASKEQEIIQEVNKCLDILQSEGTGVAFPVAFEQVREDMKQVYRRLNAGNVDPLTQAIERDIIASLTDMVDALAQKLADAQQPMPPGSPMPMPPMPMPPDPSLLQRIAELKMIRAMQDRLNKRTETYSKLFPGQEQPADPIIRREVSELRERQERIFEVTNKIQKGDNQ